MDKFRTVKQVKELDERCTYFKITLVGTIIKCGPQIPLYAAK